MSARGRPVTPLSSIPIVVPVGLEPNRRGILKRKADRPDMQFVPIYGTPTKNDRIIFVSRANMYPLHKYKYDSAVPTNRINEVNQIIQFRQSLDKKVDDSYSEKTGVLKEPLDGASGTREEKEEKANK